MAKAKAKNLDFDEDAYEALKTLQTALQSQGLPVQTRLQDIASALAMYTGPEQATGMVLAFLRHTSSRGQADQDDSR